MIFQNGNIRNKRKNGISPGKNLSFFMKGVTINQEKRIVSMFFAYISFVVTVFIVIFAIHYFIFNE
jgi:hypothetical protein